MTWWRLVLLGLLAAIVPACGDDDAVDGAAEQPVPEERGTAFTWVTTLDQDGFGYVLTVEGVVGDGHATYEMHVEPLLGEDDGSGFALDYLAFAAGVAVNGFADGDEGVATSEGEIAADGRTEVRVRGAQRWYRNPWLLQEASFALGDAEWVRVSADEPVVVDLVTAVLNERYDDALRRLTAAVEAGRPIEAPTPDEESSELDEILTPWIGLRGPAYPIGAEATVTGDADEGEASWQQVLTYEPDGADGEMSGTVRWRPASAEPPEEPGDALDAAEVTAQLGG